MIDKVITFQSCKNPTQSVRKHHLQCFWHSMCLQLYACQLSVLDSYSMILRLLLYGHVSAPEEYFGSDIQPESYFGGT